MPTIPSNIPQPLPGLAPQLAKLLGQPPLRVNVSAGSQSGTGRTWRLVVLNSVDQRCAGVFRLHVWVATTVGGIPGGTQTVAFVTGEVRLTLEVMREWEVFTDSNGLAEFTMLCTAGQQRSVHALVLGVVGSSELVSY